MFCCKSFHCIFRYYAIVHPLSAMKVNSKSRTKKIIAVTWIIPIVVASPYLYCSSFQFTISSDYGVISRQICSDRFDELDNNTGTFRRVFFILLFVLMYFLPMMIIIGTCTTIAICLLRPIVIENTHLRRRDSKRRNEVNKRKVICICRSENTTPFKNYLPLILYCEIRLHNYLGRLREQLIYNVLQQTEEITDICLA